MKYGIKAPRLVRGCFLGLAMLHAQQAAMAAAYEPTDDALVLERLPARSPVAAGSKLDVDLAARLAQIHIERSRRSGDPRELGYAQGVLQAWWDAAQAPPPILLLRATLKQARHDFSGALSDLDQLLKLEPNNAQAWLTRATVLRVQGRYAEALTACAQLRPLADPFIGVLCEQSIRSLKGQLADAMTALEALRPVLSQQAPAITAWHFAEYADMAVRAGQPQAALKLYQQASALFPHDLDLMAAHADLLLDQDQTSAVVALIPPQSEVDALLLRRALALHALGDAGFAALDTRLRYGFAAAHRRGEALHLREEARYRLAMGDDPREVLKLAQRNWQTQREPWDARLLLAAAQTAEELRAADTVRQWLSETGLQDARLERRP